MMRGKGGPLDEGSGGAAQIREKGDDESWNENTKSDAYIIALL